MKTTLFQAKQAFYSICLCFFLLWDGVSSFTMLYVWENIHVLKVYRNKQLPARLQYCLHRCSIACRAAVSPAALQYRMYGCSIAYSAKVSLAALQSILKHCRWYCSAAGNTACGTEVLQALLLQPLRRYCSLAGDAAALQPILQYRSIVYFYKPLRHEYSLKHKA